MTVVPPKLAGQNFMHSECQGDPTTGLTDRFEGMGTGRRIGSFIRARRRGPESSSELHLGPSPAPAAGGKFRCRAYGVGRVIRQRNQLRQCIMAEMLQFMDLWSRT